MAAEANTLTALPTGVTDDDLGALVRLGKAVGDRLRASILQVLLQESYSVGELCSLFAVPQPALSHHLKILHKAGLVARRREGNSIFYRRASLAAGSAAGALVDQLDQTPADSVLRGRIDTIHQSRNQRSAEFFARNAASITAQQAEISQPATYSDVVLEMIEAALGEGSPHRHALEVGPGDGQLLAQLSQRFDDVTGVDNASTRLQAARTALRGEQGIRLRHQDFMTLPARRRYDALVAAMVVHHQASPASFFAQAARVLHRPGTLVVAELCRHDQQ